MFNQLEKINARPAPFEFYTAEELWNDPHTSAKMLEYHLNPDVDLSSRCGEFIDRSAEWIIAHFGVREGTRIADFGCGPGLYASRLAAAGADVTGIDFSERSIAHAREVAAERGLYIDYVHQNYLDYETEKRFDLIIMIFCDFCALSPAQRGTMLNKWRRLLKAGGSLLLDVCSMNMYYQREEAQTYALNQLDSFWSAERYYGFLNTLKYDDVRVSLDKYTIIEPARTRVVYNWLQYFDEGSLRAEFEDNGFDVAGIYGDVAGAPLPPDSLEMAIAARRSA
jgi:SAM-dependent methyltransferase